MSKDTNSNAAAGAVSPRPGVSALAAQALALLRRPASAEHSDTRDDITAFLRASVLKFPADPAEEIVAALRARGAQDADIVDHHIPKVARNLGDCWLSDDLPFAQVSIGSARLQGLLPLLDDSPQNPGRAPAGMALVYVAGGEDHTLGPLVLAHQLRRKGMGVHTMIGDPPDKVVDLVRQGGFDVLLISCAQSAGLASVTTLVADLRETGTSVPPILLGGAVVGLRDNIKQETGVDLVAREQSDLAPLIEALASQIVGTG